MEEEEPADGVECDDPPVKLENSERDFLSLLPLLPPSSSCKSSLLLLPPEKENEGSLNEDIEPSLRMVAEVKSVSW